METARLLRYRPAVWTLSLAVICGLAGCASIDSLERGGGGRVHDASYEEVYRSAMAALEENGFFVEREDHEKGQILAKSGVYRPGLWPCSGNLIGIFLERVGPGKTKVDIQEKLVWPAQKFVCEEKAPPVALKLARYLSEKTFTGAKPVASTASSDEAAVTPSDVDSPPTGEVAPKKNTYALVIGVEKYREKLQRADFAAHDARLMGEYLTKVLGYPEENVVVLLNDRATRTDLEKYVESWLPNHVEQDGFVFVYFSGHGAPNPKTGDAYLVPYDGDPSFVDRTGYPLKRLYESLGKLPAKDVVVMLDACFSGAGGRSVIAQGTRPMVLSVENPILASGKTVVLAASAGDQVSSTYQQKSHGLLTYFFLKGLQGEADRNRDGTIELTELFEYVKPQVQRVARREFNNDQTPQLVGSPEMLQKGVRLIERANP
ncbi:MAG: caspase family protein [Nitrospirae bacterium]|nr:caspase family protein [Nitrospirota bacterium]